MLTLREIKKVKTYEDLEKLGIGNVYCDISHRGGGIGFYASDIARAFDIEESQLPRHFGAGCNYLGGGVRGSIFSSDCSINVPVKKARILKILADACVRVYKNVENGEGLNDNEYPDGDTNWDALATQASRKAGIKSAY